MSLTANLGVHSTADLSLVRGFSACEAQALLTRDISLAFGDNENCIERAITQRYVIPASGTQVIDLCGIDDVFDDGVVLWAVKLVMVAASSANAAAVTVKPNTVNPWTAPFGSAADVVRAEPGGALLLVNTHGDGWSVTEDSADKLLLTNTSASAAATVDVMILGIDGRWDYIWGDGITLGWDDGESLEAI